MKRSKYSGKYLKFQYQYAHSNVTAYIKVLYSGGVYKTANYYVFKYITITNNPDYRIMGPIYIFMPILDISLREDSKNIISRDEFINTFYQEVKKLPELTAESFIKRFKDEEM